MSTSSRIKLSFAATVALGLLAPVTGRATGKAQQPEAVRSFRQQLNRLRRMARESPGVRPNGSSTETARQAAAADLRVFSRCLAFLGRSAAKGDSAHPGLQGLTRTLRLALDRAAENASDRWGSITGLEREDRTGHPLVTAQLARGNGPEVELRLYYERETAAAHERLTGTRAPRSARVAVRELSIVKNPVTPQAAFTLLAVDPRAGTISVVRDHPVKPEDGE